MENLAVKFANNGDFKELQHGLEKIHHEPKSQHSKTDKGTDRHDRASGEKEQEAYYSSMSRGNINDAHMSQAYQGCRICGQHVVHLDGKCNAIKPTGIRDSSTRLQANISQGTRGSHRVLFEDNDWRGEAFHIPIIIDDSIFEGLDDMVAPVTTPATILGEKAIAVAATAAPKATNGEEAMEEAAAEASAMFHQMGIAAPYVQEFEDESEVSHTAAMDPPV